MMLFIIRSLIENDIANAIFVKSAGTGDEASVLYEIRRVMWLEKKNDKAVSAHVSTVEHNVNLHKCGVLYHSL